MKYKYSINVEVELYGKGSDSPRLLGEWLSSILPMMPLGKFLSFSITPVMATELKDSDECTLCASLIPEGEYVCHRCLEQCHLYNESTNTPSD